MSEFLHESLSDHPHLFIELLVQIDVADPLGMSEYRNTLALLLHRAHQIR